MRFIKYEGEIPGAKRAYNKLKRYFEGFIRSNYKVAKIELEEGEYKSSEIAVGTLKKAAKRYDYPVELFRRGDEIFIIRTDM